MRIRTGRKALGAGNGQHGLAVQPPDRLEGYVEALFRHGAADEEHPRAWVPAELGA